MNGFLGSAILETAIGAAFVYLLLAIFCTAAVEWIAGALNTRADTLRTAISRLLEDQMCVNGQTLLSAFYGHPIVNGLMNGDEHPSFLSPRAFSTAILDLTHNPGATIRDLPDGPVRTALLALVKNGEGDFAHLQASVETWFNDAMHRASCRYQRHIQAWTLAVAIIATVATNADTFYMLRRPGHLPGWEGASIYLNPWGWVARLTGWSLTVGAVSLGAPFWFDVLNRFVNLRNTGRAPQESDKSAR